MRKIRQVRRRGAGNRLPTTLRTRVCKPTFGPIACQSELWRSAAERAMQSAPWQSAADRCGWVPTATRLPRARRLKNHMRYSLTDKILFYPQGNFSHVIVPPPLRRPSHCAASAAGRPHLVGRFVVADRSASARVGASARGASPGPRAMRLCEFSSALYRARASEPMIARLQRRRSVGMPRLGAAAVSICRVNFLERYPSLRHDRGPDRRHTA